MLKWEQRDECEPNLPADILPSLAKPKIAILPIPQNILAKLVEVVKATDEFPYHEGF